MDEEFDSADKERDEILELLRDMKAEIASLKSEKSEPK